MEPIIRTIWADAQLVCFSDPDIPHASRPRQYGVLCAARCSSSAQISLGKTTSTGRGRAGHGSTVKGGSGAAGTRPGRRGRAISVTSPDDPPAQCLRSPSASAELGRGRTQWKRRTPIMPYRQYKTARSARRRALGWRGGRRKSGARDSGRETRICVPAGRRFRRPPSSQPSSPLVRRSPDGSKGSQAGGRAWTCRYRGRWPLAVGRGQSPRFARDPHCVPQG